MDQSLSCDFDNSFIPLCNWQHDLNDWRGRWKHWISPNVNNQLIDRHLCLQMNKEDSSDDDSVEAADLTVRLWSQLIRVKKLSEEAKPKCLSLSYRFEDDLLKNLINDKNNLIENDQSQLKLSVLMRREGSCTKISVDGRKESLLCENERLWTSDYAFPTQSELLSTTSWKTIYLSLIDSNEKIISDYKLILEGTIPAGYPDARICVDNITSYTEPCSGKLILEKASAPLPSQWSWAQYFGLTFVGALILGLIIPVLFLVILIWACRRRHHTMHSNYTNSKLFSTNLWYYIGGKEICDDPNGFRGSSSLLRSKQFNSPSATGTLLNGGGGHHMMSNADVMDLPDVVVPGGRVVAFNYSGNTLGSNTLRHNHNNAGYTNTNYLPSSQNGQVMLANVNGTAPLSGSGVNVSTVARTCQNPMPLVSNELIQQQPRNQQQNENYTYQTNTAFGESTSVGLMAANQSPMLMTQSMAPNYGSDTNHPAQSNVSSTNAQQMNRFNTNAQVYNKPQQQPRAQSQYFPPIQHPQSNIVQQPQQQTVQPIQQPQLQQPPSFQNQLQPQQQPQQQQLLSNQSYISNQFNPQQQHQSIQQQIQQQFPLPPPPATCQQLNPPHPTHLQQTQHQNQPAAPFVQQPVNQHPFNHNKRNNNNSLL
ncbi:hypothetical protein EWB00_003944 [Schistosoma japonicum]|uniref:MAM domain-containing protein n=1 Tax=Schistosoma japonicum TaxID=6182 RepID=A0A4Z2DVH1_SCHJA|nr:hypothetical protein EWB00_003944 [Schistosoma japonicum]